MQRIPLRSVGIDGRPGGTPVLQGFETTHHYQRGPIFPSDFLPPSPPTPCLRLFPHTNPNKHTHAISNKHAPRQTAEQAGIAVVTHLHPKSRDFLPPCCISLQDAQALLPLDPEHPVPPHSHTVNTCPSQSFHRLEYIIALIHPALPPLAANGAMPDMIQTRAARGPAAHTCPLGVSQQDSARYSVAGSTTQYSGHSA